MGFKKKLFGDNPWFLSGPVENNWIQRFFVFQKFSRTGTEVSLILWFGKNQNQMFFDFLKNSQKLEPEVITKIK